MPDELLGLDIPVAESGVALDLTQGREGARPLWLLPDGTFSVTPSASPAGMAGMAAADALVAAARWISSRRSATFERLFPPSAFHPDQPLRQERLSETQARKLLDQLRGAIREAAVSGAEAKRDATGAAQVRSAALTVLAHLVATAINDPSFRAVADAAAAEIFALIEAEQGHETARGALRAHAIQLLQLRGPALRPEDRDRARLLLRGLLRLAPPYDELTGPFRFAMCSGHDFHEGECQILTGTFNFTEIPVPEGAPRPPGSGGYKVFEAPFKSPHGQPIQVFARSAAPSNENFEMGEAFFTGLLINRHANLGSYDMRAASVAVTQRGYKLMMNTQCAGLTTRFAISRMFPDADIYSSWDATYFREPSDPVDASEGLDCFIALLRGMTERDDHAGLEQRMKGVEWPREVASVPGFVQFVGPANPLVVSRFNDLNLDGRADLYDGFLDFHLTAIAEDLRASMTPRDPGVAATQISGEAATGLNWAAGSLNRVTQYSELWAALPGESELLYIFQSGGFYSQREPPDVPGGPLRQDPGKLPAACSYQKSEHTMSGLLCEVMFHSHLSHAASELKRLLCAADAFWRAIDLGYLPQEGALATIEGRRGAVLLLLAGLLEFPADQNFIDGLWSMALSALNFPEISRSVVRACTTEEDHDASNYYGSKRGIGQLIGDGEKKGAIESADPVAMEKLRSADPQIGRASEIVFATA